MDAPSARPPPETVAPVQWTDAQWQRLRERPRDIERAFFAAAKGYVQARGEPPRLAREARVAVWMGGGCVDMGAPLGQVHTGFWEGRVLGRVRGRGRYVVRWEVLGTQEEVYLPRRGYLNRDSDHAWFAPDAEAPHAPGAGAARQRRCAEALLEVAGDAGRERDERGGADLPMLASMLGSTSSGGGDGADDAASFDDSDTVHSASTVASAQSSYEWRHERDDERPIVVDPNLQYDRDRANRQFLRAWADDGVAVLVAALSTASGSRTPAMYEPEPPEHSEAHELAVFARRLTRYFKTLKAFIYDFMKDRGLVNKRTGISASAMAKCSRPEWTRDLSFAFRQLCRGFRRLCRRVAWRAPGRLQRDIFAQWLVEAGQRFGVPAAVVPLHRYQARVARGLDVMARGLC